MNETRGNISQEGTIVVIATHDPHTRAACSRIIALARADVALGSPRDDGGGP